VLHMINKAIRFRATQLICKGADLAIAKVMFNAFKSAWINTYLSLPNFVVYDYKTNFNFEKFQISFKFIKSTLKFILIKAHHSIDKVKRYHYLLRCAYEIVMKKHLKLFDANQLQIVIKVINNIIRLNRLIPTLLIFGVYFRITELNFPNLTIKQKAYNFLDVGDLAAVFGRRPPAVLSCLSTRLMSDLEPPKF